MKQTIKIDSKQALMVAHRGVSGLEKENTNLAFVAAGNRSYWGIESDVRKTADGYFVMIHDKDTLRVAGVDRKVSETDFKALRGIPFYDVDGSEERVDIRIPTLNEYLRICRDYGKIAVLELKGSIQSEDVEKVIRVVEAEYDLEKTVLISFHKEKLISARALRPDVKLQWLVQKELPEGMLKTLQDYRMDLDISYKIVTKELVDDVHSIGAKINVWTVNHVEDAERMIAYGVDYITTNILE